MTEPSLETAIQFWRDDLYFAIPNSIREASTKLAIKALEEMREREKNPGHFWQYDPKEHKWFSEYMLRENYRIREARNLPPKYPMPNPFEYQELCTELPFPKPRTWRDVTAGEMVEWLAPTTLNVPRRLDIIEIARVMAKDFKPAPSIGHEPRLGAKFPQEKP